MNVGRPYAIAGAAVHLLLLGACSSEAPTQAETRTAENRAAATREAAVPAPQGPERLILAVGDSLYAGYGLGEGESLPAQLQNELRRSGINATIVNAGVSGDTSAAGRQRLAFALDNLPRSPDLVILGLGGNDALRQIAPAETRANMTAMMEELKRRKVSVVLTGMRAPPNLGPDYATAFEPIWPDLARRYGADLYPFILDGVIGDPSLMLADGIHPSSAGAAKMAASIEPLAIAALSDARR